MLPVTDLYRLMSNFDNNVNNEGMNDKIIKKIQEIISNNHQEKKLILKGISIVDPYLFLNISNDKDKGHENAKKFIDEIIKKFNSVKIKIYSDVSRKNNGKTVDIVQVKKFFKDKSNINLYNSNNWHDRPIVLHFEKESKPEYFGILIGSSIGSIEGKKIYFVCDINDEDTKKTIDILKKFETAALTISPS
ncbi:hypothetical protein QEJ31_06615 [Pigmentibacter sp. JX0631]|uniref:hypothetical protein n=1 Tax=Pigmentibacter sp. JX0631 TaxID=2976982 RepID=UPI002469B51B|nr:hypothetical protein [Pigmentibacter sp. JX0631]WGL61263.1 hypothetical protein QEJ31_06615 [Pigmentibacter sp. JX0631]